MRRAGTSLAMRWVPLLLLLLLSGSLAADRPKAAEAQGERTPLADRDHGLLERELAALAPQRPGKTDLYVLGFAGALPRLSGWLIRDTTRPRASKRFSNSDFR